MEPIVVRCRSSYKGDQRPMSVVLDGSEEDVWAILAEWVDERPSGRRRVFRLMLRSRRTVVVSQEPSSGEWSLDSVQPP